MTGAEVREIASPAFGRRIAESLVVLPIGATEPHGPHLPLGTDTLVSRHLADEVARVFPTMILPEVHYGCVSEPERVGGEFPGIIGLRMSTFTNLIADVLGACYAAGGRRFLLIDCHMANRSALREAASSIHDRPGAKVMGVAWWDFAPEDLRNRIAADHGTPRDVDHHAAMVETSLVQHLRPDLVGPLPDSPDLPARRRRYWVSPVPAAARTRTGVVYDASQAAAEIGAVLMPRIVGALLAAVRAEFSDLKGW